MALTTIVTTRRRIYTMKKIMSLMLGLSLVLGSVAFAEDKKADTTTAPKKEKKAKKEKKSKDAAGTATSAPAK
jgi:hypothetical protein